MAVKSIINGTCISETISGEVVLEITDNTIASITNNKPDANTEIIDAQNCFITPGLIDIHIHGGCGCNFLDNPLQNLDKLLNNFLQHGVCTFLPTIMTAKKALMLESIDFFSSLKIDEKLPQVAGINIEGPFLSKDFKGIHPQEKIQAITSSELKEYINDRVKIITLAPEAGLTEELIKELTSKGIVVALGHSGCSYEMAMSSASSGAKLVTHLYNAMSKFHHRSPGLTGAALTNDELYVELICDGFHVHTAALSMAIKAKPDNRIILITDCIALRDAETSDYFVGSDKITVQGGRPVNKKGTLSGSVLTLDTAVKNLVQWGLTDFKTAIKYATYNPAELLNISNNYGDIKPGMPANLTFWDKATLNIRATMIKGCYYLFAQADF